VLNTGSTSSLGRLSRRTDLAAAAVVLVFAAFANAAAMVPAGTMLLSEAGTRLPWLATTVGSFAGVVAAALAAASLVWLAGALSRTVLSEETRSEAFCRTALALVPIGMGMWAAHLLFHLWMSVPALAPLIAQASADFHLHASIANWSSSMGAAAGNSLLQMQLLLLGSGLLVTLYVAWRMSNEAGQRLSRHLLAWAPRAMLAVALYIFGFWLLLQPMQMRGVAMGGM
jgi:hypothetical protein